MSVNDPIGFLGNFKIKGMILLQSIWKSGMGWDDPIPDSVFEEWKKWIANLKSIVNVIYVYGIHLAEDLQLHVFVDVSDEAYSAVCYLRAVLGGAITTSFMASKVRVASLELLAAVRGATR